MYVNHYFMVAYPGCHDVIHLSVATGKKLPLFLDLTHVNPYSVKSNFRLDNLRCLSEVIESNFCSLHGFEYWLSSRKHKGVSQRISWFFLVVPSLISCFIVMFCLLVPVRHVLALLINLNVHRKTELFCHGCLAIVSQAKKKKLRFLYVG